LISAAIWALSPSITGHKEPWDATGYYYVAALSLGGLVSGLFAPESLWTHYVGSLLGQIIWALLSINVGPFFVLGVGLLLTYSMLFLGGAFLGSRLRSRLGGRAPAA
jgi:hypothetical protein